ncbi:hypothetical protein [Mesorhizobium sp. B2-3-4]|uniref:hypothetical protein n=1 Tax=Mesorhizobium sp. B2-3-4 TaxID=2589959 RepID=UPI00112BA0BB|nr:hypothetical protein [Mesorhizobium sp. B2-3-4]TPM39578.1 hypothetical protein FJ967_08830 [Mesorhizobium sp. B2-3-4]
MDRRSFIASICLLPLTAIASPATSADKAADAALEDLRLKMKRTDDQHQQFLDMLHSIMIEPYEEYIPIFDPMMVP